VSQWWWALLPVVAVVAVRLGSDYQLFQLSRLTTTALAVASLVLLTGHAGQVSAGQGAIFGLGAYACAVLIDGGQWPWLAAVLGAALVCAAAGSVLAFPALRLRGLGLALVTLSLAVLFPLAVSRWDGLTGGPTGLDLPPVGAPQGWGLSDAQFLFLVTLTALLGVLLLIARWARGRTGRALAALRTDPAMARAHGVDVATLTVVTSGTAAAMAGLGGALNGLVLQSVIPDSYTVTLSLALFTGAVVGGIRSWTGAVIGAAFVVFLPQVASDALPSSTPGPWAQVCYAASLLITVRLAPRGIAGVLGALRRPQLFRARRADPVSSEGDP
jgi:branched-chain amino acid transport system permease protein